MSSRMSKYLMMICVWLVSVIPVSVSAIPITIVSDSANSTEKLGQFTAKLEYQVVSEGAAWLWITLANTSPATNGGWITGFVFNNPGNVITDASLSFNPRPGEYLLMGGASFNNSVSASPFAEFDIGAALGGSFEGVGSPTAGITTGVEERFRFTLKGAGVEKLTEASFIDELKEDGQFFAVRFRGFNDNGSDKVPGIVDPGLPVPEPGTLLLLGLGLIGIGIIMREMF